jgi:hypothetical protein
MVALKLGYLFWKKELVVEYHVEISQTRDICRQSSPRLQKILTKIPHQSQQPNGIPECE